MVEGAITRDGAARALGRPAEPGLTLAEVETPCLVVDLDALERNLAAMRRFVDGAGVALRAHAKCHKSAEIARLQIEEGGAVGVCCQTASEAEALAAAGIGDILVSNQAPGARRSARLARAAQRARIGVCVDDARALEPLCEAATAAGVEIRCLVEIDVGAGRCGVRPGEEAVALAKAIDAADALRFDGLQAYQGAAQHAYDHAERKALIDAAIAAASETVSALARAGLACPTVAGGGTGSFPFEAASGVYTELQCGSYVFMDADYGRVREADGAPLDRFENALFVLTEVMSKTRPGVAVCDAGLKALAMDSGPPEPFGRADVRYLSASDEHGLLADPEDALDLGSRLRLVPGHCDPTCNLYDWYVVCRGERVEAVWSVTARGLGL